MPQVDSNQLTVTLTNQKVKVDDQLVKKKTCLSLCLLYGIGILQEKYQKNNRKTNAHMPDAGLEILDVIQVVRMSVT